MNIVNETSSADFDCQVFITCGKKAIVVKMPAHKPNKSVEFKKLKFILSICLQ